MGVRRFGPGAGQFLTPDFFYGSLADLTLSTDPLTQNRYDLAGGNPISFGEWDGHLSCDICGAFLQTVSGIKDPGAFVQGVKDGLGDLGQGALALGKLAVECAPTGPTEELAQCGSHVSAIATNVKNDPGGFIGSLVDAKDFVAGWKKGDLSYWEGRITPSVALTLVSFGTGGAAVKAGEGVGTAARAEQALGAVARAGKVESAVAREAKVTEAASEATTAGKPAASSGAPRASEGAAGGSGAPNAVIKPISGGAPTGDLFPALPSIKDLQAAANAPDRNLFTAAGRALQKHSNRTGSPFPFIGGGNPARYNPVAESLVNDIVNDPAAQISTRVHGGLGAIIDIYGGQFGYGVRYSTSGRFIGFLNP
jgi:hypothetical protein